MATPTSTTRTTSALCAQSADMLDAGSPAPFTLAELTQAYFDCRKSKRNTKTALQFEMNLERNLVALRNSLLDGTYTIGKSICFVITHPKPREVWAAEFTDRIVHHLMYNRIAPAIEKTFIADSCACIKERGTLYAAKRLESKIRSATQNWKQDCYYLKCDLANFFVSINKATLASLIAKRVTDPWWLELTLKILHHDPRENYQLHCPKALLEKVPPHKRLAEQPAHLGLPIGNLSSQFFANIYLNELDQFAKHTLKARRYIRYVDDFVILHESAQWLNEARAKIEAFLPAQLQAQLNPSKTIIQPVSRGVDFVGQVIKPWCRTTRKRTLNHALRQVKTKPAEQLRETVNSYFGLLRQASHSHKHCTQLARLVLHRGKAVNGDLTKTYRNPNDNHDHRPMAAIARKRTHKRAKPKQSTPVVFQDKPLTKLAPTGNSMNLFQDLKR